MKSQQPDNQSNILIAIVLSMAVLLAWSYFVAGPQMEAEKARQTALQSKNTNTAAPAAAGAGPAATAPAPAAGIAGVKPATRELGIAASPRVAIETPSLKGSIALKGGAIDDLSLLKHHETVDPKSPNIVLFSPLYEGGGYFARLGWIASGKPVKVPDSETLWTAKTPGPLTPSSPITLEWSNGEGLTFRRNISVDENYMFSINEEVENKSPGDIALRPFARLFRFGAPKIPAVWIQHEGLLGVPGDAGLQEITFATATAEPPVRFEGKTGGWVGITDKYWASAIIPDQKVAYSATLEGEAPKDAKSLPMFLAEFETEPTVVAAGSVASVRTNLYAGAKQAAIIEEYQDKLGIEKFDLMIDWGWFYFLTKPMNHALTWLYGLLGNFGLAILSLTVFVKLIFYPLANKSYESMAKMKKLQPQMEALRERHKDDKSRMQQELMQLYQKEKINPAAGCLPILVQIPVFFALYKVLYTSIDMRHAPFVGWIQDLSAPDPTSIFNLFGLLPFGVPDFLLVGVWPIIMGATMWVQMQLNPPQPDPVQQQIFSWMPLIFTFLLATFPAGLVIYWAWNNVLSIMQQWYITKKQGAEIHLGANFRRTFGPVLKLIGIGKETKG
ncbi:MAG: membrane protein insertase YidC [Hyphomicrobium sp. 32-62-53]|nr:MAG: membrane protein insertase YidC [Hyphomicrobium sp. 12-62-95]OYY01242.1 MAG: membrane protein insertase YidC [Hyphomicrobium sp. 32-62-53]